LHTILSVSRLDDAIAELAVREGCPTKLVGYWDSAENSKFTHVKAIGCWARERNLDAVVWTALGARFMGIDGRVPSEEESIAYLSKLEGDVRRIAEEYIRKAPMQIRTPYRSLFEKHFGWTSI